MQRKTGTISVHARGFGFVEFPPDPDDPTFPTSAFVAPPDLKRLLAGDVVTCEPSGERDGRVSARKLELVNRHRKTLFGKVVEQGKALELDPQVGNTPWPLRAKRGTKLDDGDWVLATVSDDAAIYDSTVSASDASLHRVIARHNLRVEFPEEVVQETRKVAKDSQARNSDTARATTRDALESSARRDLRDIPTITIDAQTSRDLDDALSVLPADPEGAIRVLVSIADVDDAVPENGVIDLEARARATSVYLAGRVIPMIPPLLSEHALSLLPGVDRACVTVELRIDLEGNVTSTDLYPSLIRSTARLDYDGVADALERGNFTAVPEAVRPTVRWLRAAASRIATVRAARGGVEILREEAQIHLDPATGEPTELDARENNAAHKLVERLMVAANEAVGEWLVDRGLPGIFRVHEPPTAERVAELSEGAKNLGFETGLTDELPPLALTSLEHQFAQTQESAAFQSLLSRALGPARYTGTPGLHYGLAAEMYLHFTSPIRRYSDLTVHRIVKGYLSGKRNRHLGEAELETLSVKLNEAAYRSKKAETERLWMLAARLFTNRLGEKYAGTIVEIRSFGLVVQLRGSAISGIVAVESLPGGPYRYEQGRRKLSSSSRTFSVGDAIAITVTGADETLGRIHLGLDEPGGVQAATKKSAPAAAPSSTGSTSRSASGNTSRGNTSRGNSTRGNSTRRSTSRDDTSRGNTSRDNSSRGNTSRGNSSQDNTAKREAPKADATDADVVSKTRRKISKRRSTTDNRAPNPPATLAPAAKAASAKSEPQKRRRSRKAATEASTEAKPAKSPRSKSTGSSPRKRKSADDKSGSAQAEAKSTERAPRTRSKRGTRRSST